MDMTEDTVFKANNEVGPTTAFIGNELGKDRLLGPNARQEETKEVLLEVLPVIMFLCLLCLLHVWTAHSLTKHSGYGRQPVIKRLPPTTTDDTLRDEPVVFVEIHKNETLPLVNETMPYELTEGQDELNILRMEGHTQSLADLNFRNFTTRELSLTCHSYLENANTICMRKLRMGNIGDGGWDICDDYDIRPKPPCVIYSFGIGRDFSFDDEVSRWYKCHVYSFDPTISQKSHNRSDLVHFYEVGLTDKIRKEQTNYKTFSGIREMLGHAKGNVKIVKMDIEGDEWPVLLQMVRSKEFDHIDQLLIEFHINELKRPFLLKYVHVLRLLQAAGLKIFHTQRNEGCAVNVNGFPPITAKCVNVLFRKEWA